MQLLGLLLLGLLGAASAQVSKFPPAPPNTTYTWFCEYKIGDGPTANYPNGCYYKQCPQGPPPDPSWKVYAWQPFNNATICKIFQEEKPICEMEDHQCPEAANFQLVYTRLEDFHRVYARRDWNGLQHFFNNDTKMLQPDDGKFTIKSDFVTLFPSLVSTYPELVAKPRQVLTVKYPDNSSIVHSVGDWGVSEEIKTLNSPFYARWSVNENDHWTMDTVVLALTGNMSFSAKAAQKTREAPADVKKAIAARNVLFSKMYAAGNFTELLSEMYADSAAVVNNQAAPTDSDHGPLVYRKGIVAYLKTKPFKGVFTPTLVELGYTNKNVAHEIGTVNGTKSPYYARWVLQGKKTKKWMLETHMFALVHQKVSKASSVESTRTLVI